VQVEDDAVRIGAVDVHLQRRHSAQRPLDQLDVVAERTTREQLVELGPLLLRGPPELGLLHHAACCFTFFSAHLSVSW
jgi:hypothetical protein